MITLTHWLIAVAAVALVASLACVVLFAWDKRRAARGGRRVPEAQLHLIELLGGWPGSLLASRWFRHKTIKPGYRIKRVMCIVVHTAAVVAVGWLLA